MKSLNPKVQSWHNKSVWLVGASSGIGMALAIELSRLGAKVAVSARSQSALDELVQQHPLMFACVLDVQDAQSVAKASESVQAHQGLDWVIFLAGHYLAQDAKAFSYAQMEKHQDINYMGACRVLECTLPTLLSQKSGHISLVSSVAGFVGLPKSLAYGPTKAAMINLAECLYLDLSDFGVGVSVVNPGFVKTPLTAQNTFEMPYLLSPQEAAQHMIQGWERGEFEIHFPKAFTRVLKALRILPYSWYFAIIKKWVIQ
jgi:short-subunit dehydrogenase